MKGSEFMISNINIQQAKEVSIYKVLDYFDWGVDTSGRKILCPSIDHDDRHPSVAINLKNNTCRCFTCSTTFDTISLYSALSQKVNGENCSFPQAIREVLAIDGLNLTPSKQFYIPTNQGNANQDTYQKILNNCKPLNGYELNYLHSRGIFLYDAYVYEGNVYTKQSLEKQIANESDGMKLAKLKEIEDKGTLYHGIGDILRQNRIRIMHNYYQGVNSIIYQVDYEEEDVEHTHFLVDTSRSMMVKKTLDDTHEKWALGDITWNWLAEGVGIEKGNIFLCEGMEDALSFVQNGEKAISLNSITSINEFMDDLWCIPNKKELTFVIAFDHDKGGEKATRELIEMFDQYNQAQKHKTKQIQYRTCNYPMEFHDINDYWKFRVYGV